MPHYNNLNDKSLLFNVIVVGVKDETEFLFYVEK